MERLRGGSSRTMSGDIHDEVMHELMLRFRGEKQNFCCSNVDACTLVGRTYVSALRTGDHTGSPLPHKSFSAAYLLSNNRFYICASGVAGFHWPRLGAGN